MMRILMIALLAGAAAVGPVSGQEADPPQQAEVPAAAEAAPPQAVQVDISFGTGVDRIARTLEGAAGSFPAEIDQVFCFTRLVGLEYPAAVTHAWFHEGKTMARVDLNVNSADWRTWSSKRVLPGWTGLWEVKVLDAAGKVLGTAEFELQ